MILEVDNNVTYVCNEEKIVGKRNLYHGQLSLQEYEAIAGKSAARKSFLKDSFGYISPRYRTRETQKFSTHDFAHKMTAIRESDEKDERIVTESVRISNNVSRQPSLKSKVQKSNRVIM